MKTIKKSYFYGNRLLYNQVIICNHNITFNPYIKIPSISALCDTDKPIFYFNYFNINNSTSTIEYRVRIKWKSEILNEKNYKNLKTTVVRSTQRPEGIVTSDDHICLFINRNFIVPIPKNCIGYKNNDKIWKNDKNRFPNGFGEERYFGHNIYE